jgi:dihydrolipoamide dehydrogenase
MSEHYDLVVLGAGPGGYTAAFRAADLGKKVALIERHASLGGVCLNVGCIPSKALLHVGQVIDSAAQLADHGVRFGAPEIDLPALRSFKEGVVSKLTTGLAGLAKRRKVTVITGEAQFQDSHHLTVATADGDQDGDQDGERVVGFDHCIIAAGSRVVQMPGLPDDDARIMDSTGALALQDIPNRLLVIGGGIIGLEMACVYRSLGAQVSVVEMMDQLMAGADAALVKPLHQHLSGLGVQIWTGSKVTAVKAGKAALSVQFEGEQAPNSADFDRILVAVGRRPNGDQIGAERAGIDVDERGFIAVDGQLRTQQPHIFAIGDLIGQPMLAHKASYEGKLAAEVIAGHDRIADARVIPSVAYTDPEVAWVGLTEQQAKAEGVDVEVSVFPWAASGRALGMDRSEGHTRLISAPDTGRVLGAGVVGCHAGDLIAELTLAIEMGATIADLALTIHPHPTLSESVMMAAEVCEGTITDLYLPKR